MKTEKGNPLTLLQILETDNIKPSLHGLKNENMLCHFNQQKANS